MNLLKKDVIMHETFSKTYIHGYRKNDVVKIG